MELKNVVASYANKVEGKVEIDLKALAQDPEAGKLFVAAVLNSIKTKRNVCIFVPASSQNNHLGSFINELALNLKREVLVTGEVAKLRGTFVRCSSVKDVVIIMQLFGNHDVLGTQIAAVRETGRNVSVLSLVAHSKEELETYAKEQNVPVTSIVYTEEI